MTDAINQPETILSPEDQLRNVARIMLEQSTILRYHNGHGRPATYPANIDAIAGTGRQLAEMILAYLDGDLKPLNTRTDMPF